MQNNYLQSDIFNQDSYSNGQCVIPPVHGKGGIWISGIQFAKNIKKLDELKIGAVVSAVDLYMGYPQRIKNIKFKLNDDDKQELRQIYSQAYNFIQENLKQTNVLVHCAAGISRCSAVLISYLMRKNKWKFAIAYEKVSSARPQCYPNTNFQRQLLQYEKSLNI